MLAFYKIGFQCYETFFAEILMARTGGAFSAVFTVHIPALFICWFLNSILQNLTVKMSQFGICSNVKSCL